MSPIGIPLMRDSAICLSSREWRFARFEDADSEIGAPSGRSRGDRHGGHRPFRELPPDEGGA